MWFLTLHRWTERPKGIPDGLDAHRAWVLEQQRRGRVLFSGPSRDRSLGIMVFAGADEQEIAAICSTEPWIRDGVRSVEVVPWDVHELLGFDLLGGAPNPRGE